MDVLHFLYSSTLPETRVIFMTDFLNLYFITLSSSLKKLGIDLVEEGYIFQSFYGDYQNFSLQGMLEALMVLPEILEKNENEFRSTNGYFQKSG